RIEGQRVAEDQAVDRVELAAPGPFRIHTMEDIVGVGHVAAQQADVQRTGEGGGALEVEDVVLGAVLQPADLHVQHAARRLRVVAARAVQVTGGPGAADGDGGGVLQAAVRVAVAIEHTALQVHQVSADPAAVQGGARGRPRLHVVARRGDRAGCVNHHRAARV